MSAERAPEPVEGKNSHARIYLPLQKAARQKQAKLDAHYVQLAYKYGLSVDEISRESGLTVDLVRRMLLGGEAIAS